MGCTAPLIRARTTKLRVPHFDIRRIRGESVSRTSMRPAFGARWLITVSVICFRLICRISIAGDTLGARIGRLWHASRWTPMSPCDQQKTSGVRWLIRIQISFAQACSTICRMWRRLLISGSQVRFLPGSPSSPFDQSSARRNAVARGLGRSWHQLPRRLLGQSDPGGGEARLAQ